MIAAIQLVNDDYGANEPIINHNTFLTTAGLIVPALQCEDATKEKESII